MKQSLKFVPPVRETTLGASRRDVYEHSVGLFGQRRYVEALHALLDYLNPELRTKYGDATGREFRIPHGSIVVGIRIADDRVDVHADFLRLPERGRVAMLRQVLEMNISRLRLPRFVKDGDRLSLAYSCPLAETHPHKVLGVLGNICSVGDRYDDEFCTKFGAERCYEPQVTPYAAEDVDRICAELQTLGQEALAAVGEYNAQRRFRHSWYVLFTFFYQLQYFASPQGQLAGDLEKVCADMDEEGLFSDLVGRGEAYLSRLLAMPREELARDLYYVDTLVSPRRSSSLQNIQEAMEEEYEAATEAMQQADYESALLLLTYKFYQACALYDMPGDVSAVIAGALRKASGQAPEAAAEILWTAMDKVMEGELVPDIDLTELIAGNPAAQAAVQQAGARVVAVQQTMASDGMQALQQRMMEAMGRGDMAEDMRLAGEMQQRVMQGMFNND